MDTEKDYKEPVGEEIENTDDLIDGVKESDISEESKEWLEKRQKRNDEINTWKEETEYEYIKNIDIINNTIDKQLKANIDDWYEDYRGEGIVDKAGLKRAMEKIEYEFMMKECVELESEVVKATQQLSGNSEYCIYIDYKFRMDEGMAMHKRWKFDITDIIRDNKLGWLFD